MIKKIAEMLRNKEISCTELTKKYLDEIDKCNPKLNAYVKVTPEYALNQAKIVDDKIKKGENLHILAGIPMTLKDNMSTKGIETTCCSKILSGYKPIYNASVWEQLKACDAVMLGKTNMDEFAMGSTCETSCYGGAKNPINTDYCAGGSSGGVSSAVGGNIAVYGLGSDTGGSIREPASFCSLVGLKPTYGAVSRYGLVAFASSLDQIGPITYDVEDCALVYDNISAYDKMDSTSIGSKEKTLGFLNNPVKGKKIGVVKEYFEGLNPEIKDAIYDALKTYEKMGCEIIEFSMPILKNAVSIYYILACAEASSNLGRFDGIRYGYHTKDYKNFNDMIIKTRSEGFGDEVKRRILLGTFVLSSGYFDAYYKKAQALRGTMINMFDNAFKKCSVIIAPTVPTCAYPSGNKFKDQTEVYLTDICTVPVNITGIPAVSIPCGVSKMGLPIGLQIIGKSFMESEILNFAYLYEKEKGIFVKSEMGVRL